MPVEVPEGFYTYDPVEFRGQSRSEAWKPLVIVERPTADQVRDRRQRVREKAGRESASQEVSEPERQRVSESESQRVKESTNQRVRE